MLYPAEFEQVMTALECIASVQGNNKDLSLRVIRKVLLSFAIKEPEMKRYTPEDLDRMFPVLVENDD